MRSKARAKRAVAFFDGQNLYHGARDAFGIAYPNFDPLALARLVCRKKGWELVEARFYTGIPSKEQDIFWHEFWSRKIVNAGQPHEASKIGRKPLPKTPPPQDASTLVVYCRELRYTNSYVRLPDGTTQLMAVGREKGIDVRIALDMVRLARERKYDIGILFSQDQDFSEVAREVKDLAAEQGREITIASAFPKNPNPQKNRGIMTTEWVLFNRRDYFTCLDPNDYRTLAEKLAKPLAASEPSVPKAHDPILDVAPGLYWLKPPEAPEPEIPAQARPPQTAAPAPQPQTASQSKGRRTIMRKSATPVKTQTPEIAESPQEAAVKAKPAPRPKAASAPARRKPQPAKAATKPETRETPVQAELALAAAPAKAKGPVKPQAVKPQTAKPGTARPRIAKSETTKPQAAKPQPAKLHGAKPQLNTPQPAQPQAAPAVAAPATPPVNLNNNNNQPRGQGSRPPWMKSRGHKPAAQPQAGPTPQGAKPQAAGSAQPAPAQTGQPVKIAPGVQWHNQHARPVQAKKNRPPQGSRPAVSPQANQPQKAASPQPVHSQPGNRQAGIGQPRPQAQPQPGRFNQIQPRPAAPQFRSSQPQNNGEIQVRQPGNFRRDNSRGWTPQPKRRQDTERADLHRELPPPSSFPEHIANLGVKKTLAPKPAAKTAKTSK